MANRIEKVFTNERWLMMWVHIRLNMNADYVDMKKGHMMEVWFYNHK